jgi:hypothetical protein
VILELEILKTSLVPAKEVFFRYVASIAMSLAPNQSIAPSTTLQVDVHYRAKFLCFVRKEAYVFYRLINAQTLLIYTVLR